MKKNSTNPDSSATGLFAAVEKGNVQDCKELINKGADPLAQNYISDTPLHRASFFGKIEVVKYFIEQIGIDVNVRNTYNDTPLHRAAQSGHLDLITYLISERSALINALDKDGWTPAHQAASNGKKDAFDLLVKLGADIALKTWESSSKHKEKTPLEILNCIVG